MNTEGHMNQLWKDHRWAVLVFATICFGTVFFPYVVELSAYHYADSSAEIPAVVRALMAAGVIIAVLRLPIILVAAAITFVTSLVLAIRRTRTP
jgi:hypothetical protein